MLEVQQQQRSDQNKPEGKGRGWHNKKFCPGQENNQKDPDAVHILKFGPNNNFMRLRFREALSKKVLEREDRNSTRQANCNWCNSIQGVIIKSDDKHDIRCQYLMIDIESWCHTSPIVVHVYMDEGSTLIFRFTTSYYCHRQVLV